MIFKGNKTTKVNKLRETIKWELNLKIKLRKEVKKKLRGLYLFRKGRK